MHGMIPSSLLTNQAKQYYKLYSQPYCHKP